MSSVCLCCLTTLITSVLLLDISGSRLQAQAAPGPVNSSPQYATPAISVFNPSPPASIKSASEALKEIREKLKADRKFRQSRTAKICLGDKNISFFSSATRVQTFLIRQPRRPQDYALPMLVDLPREGPYILVSTGKEQGKDFAGQLTAALTDDHIYRESGSLCFSPYVDFRAWNGSVYADVLICFHCGYVVIHFSDGRPDCGASTWNYTHPSFVDLAKEAFPEDAVIQSLNAVIVKDNRESRTF